MEMSACATIPPTLLADFDLEPVRQGLGRRVGTSVSPPASPSSIRRSPSSPADDHAPEDGAVILDQKDAGRAAAHGQSALRHLDARARRLALRRRGGEVQPCAERSGRIRSSGSTKPTLTSPSPSGGRRRGDLAEESPVDPVGVSLQDDLAGCFGDNRARFDSLTSAPTYRVEKSTRVTMAPPFEDPWPGDRTARPPRRTCARFATTTPSNGARRTV